MKATELRIGNYVNQGQYSEQPLTAYNIYQLELKEKGGKVADYYNDIEPIKLTEDWLLRFGFHKWGVDDMPSTVSFELAPLNIQYSKNTNCYGWLFEKREENNSLSWYPKVEIKYVHSLQNLYHALTGNELTLTT